MEEKRNSNQEEPNISLNGSPCSSETSYTAQPHGLQYRELAVCTTGWSIAVFKVGRDTPVMLPQEMLHTMLASTFYTVFS